MPTPIADGANGDAADRQRRDSGVFGCTVRYTVRNIDMNEPQQRSITSFAIGDEKHVFSPALKPGDVDTIVVETDPAGADCRTERTGKLELAMTDGSGQISIANIQICVAVERG